MSGSFPFEQLYREAGWLRGLARSLIGDTQVDDLVQDAWLAVLRRPPDPLRPVRPWLARVVTNLARNRLRAERRRRMPEEATGTTRAADCPAELTQAAEAQRMLADAIVRLPDALRAVIVLRFFRGLDSRATARQLGIPDSTVRSRIQKALAALREDLDRTGGGNKAWVAMLGGVLRHLDTATAGAGTAAGIGPGTAIALAAVLGAAVAATAILLQPDAGPPAPREGVLAAAAAPTNRARGDENLPRVAVAEAADGGSAAAADVAPAAAEPGGTIAGIVLVDDAPPEWPLQLWLVNEIPEPEPGADAKVPKREPAGDLRLPPSAGGVFRFVDLPRSWRGNLRVEGHAFSDGSSAIAVAADSTGLRLHLRAGPTVTGHFNLAGAPWTGDGMCELRVGMAGEAARETRFFPFACRADGSMRVPVPLRGDWASITVRVENDGRGFVHHESPTFAPARGFDLGALEVEPVRAIEFSVRDERGLPVAGATARIDGTPWSRPSAVTDAAGRSHIGFVPHREVTLRIEAPSFGDAIVHTDATLLTIELSPAAELEIRLDEALSQRASRVRIASEQPAFVQDRIGRVATPGVRVAPDTPILVRQPRPGEPFEYVCPPPGLAGVVVTGMRAELPITVEVLAQGGQVLAARVVVLRARARTTVAFHDR
jgi:RNA polymerase sigma-70 factor (ECF subfamily)